MSMVMLIISICCFPHVLGSLNGNRLKRYWSSRCERDQVQTHLSRRWCLLMWVSLKQKRNGFWGLKTKGHSALCCICVMSIRFSVITKQGWFVCLCQACTRSECSCKPVVQGSVRWLKHLHPPRQTPLRLLWLLLSVWHFRCRLQ